MCALNHCRSATFRPTFAELPLRFGFIPAEIYEKWPQVTCCSRDSFSIQTIKRRYLRYLCGMWRELIYSNNQYTRASTYRSRSYSQFSCLPKKKEAYSGSLAFIMLPLISPQCCLSSQLPPCQPALHLPLPCSSRYSGQAKPQLSHMPCLLDV